MRDGSSPGVLLFDEDFDPRPPEPPPPEPEVIEPSFTLADLEAARDAAAREAREQALKEAEASVQAFTRRALETLASEVMSARAEAAAAAEEATEALVRLLLDCFAAAFPTMSQRHGPDEAAALLTSILPELRREPDVAVRLCPGMVGGIRDEIERFDGDLANRVRLIPTDALPPGDIRVEWTNGAASRDAQGLWTEIEAILAPAGLLNGHRNRREHALVE